MHGFKESFVAISDENHSVLIHITRLCIIITTIMHNPLNKTFSTIYRIILAFSSESKEGTANLGFGVRYLLEKL